MTVIFFLKTKILFLFLVFCTLNLSSQTICIEAGSDQKTGTKDGFRYELWNQNSQGTACMTIGSGALFSGEWNGILNYLARRGLGYNKTQLHSQIGTFYATYDCLYQPSSESGNSYLSIYGWTVDPLIEFYIVEDWRNWIPSMASGSVLKGTITANGGVYDIYETIRQNQPSIVGTATFKQYFSIRRDKRDSGTINISDHFKMWESIGLPMGKMYEVSFVVEGYKSNGTFEFKALDVFVDTNSTKVIDDKKKINILKIFPNPANNVVTVSNANGAILQICNITGKVIIEQAVTNNNQVVLLKGIKAGSYIVKVIKGQLIQTELLIVT